MNHPNGHQADATLPCGRSLDTLWDHLPAANLDTHEQTCPHCQRAHAALAPLHQAAATAEPPEPPAGFIESVMRAVRAQPRRSATLTLAATPPSRLSITEHAAATLLSAAADTVVGAISRGCRFPTPGDATHIEISISLGYGQHAHTTADQVRAAVRAAAHTQLGLHLSGIDITIDDIYAPAQEFQ